MNIAQTLTGLQKQLQNIKEKIKNNMGDEWAAFMYPIYPEETIINFGIFNSSYGNSSELPVIRIKICITNTDMEINIKFNEPYSATEALTALQALEDIIAEE